MKKIFAILVLAAMTLTVSAQDAELKSFNGKLFACQYPADFEAQTQITDESFVAEHAEDECMGSFSVSIMNQNLTPQQMKEWIDYMKANSEYNPWKVVGQGEIKGKQVIVRSECEKENDEGEMVALVKYSFRLGTSAKKSFIGELCSPRATRLSTSHCLTRLSLHARQSKVHIC